MEDENKIKKIMHIIIAIIILIIVIIVGIIIYRNIQQKINNDRFTSYVEKNNYKKDNTGVYVKETSTQNDKTTYKAIYDTYLLFKESSTSTDTDFTSITTGYQKDGTIEVTYRLEGYNKNEEIGTLYQKGTYKNGKFTCEIVSNNEFETQCPEMREKAQEFNNEVNKIFEDNNININYITLKDKNAK